MSLHTDLIHAEASGEERIVGRVEVQGGLVVVSDPAMDQLDQLVLVPRFDLDNGEAISLTEQPDAYLRQLAEDLEGATGVRTTPLHDEATCEYSATAS